MICYIKKKDNNFRIVKERIEIEKVNDDDITLGISYFYTNKYNSLMYNFFKDEKYYNIWIKFRIKYKIFS